MTDEVKTEDELWTQVNQDRATRADGEDAQALEAQKGEVDPLSVLPEPTRKLIEGLDEKVKLANEQIGMLDRKLGTANGIIGGMKQRLDESQVKLKAIDPVIEATAAARKVEAEAQAAAREQKRSDMREQFPELAEYVESTVAELKPAIVNPAPNAKPAVGEDEVKTLKLLLDLSDKAPGWKQVRDNPEFQAWIPNQPAETQAILNGWEPDAIAGVFKAFEKHKVDSVKVAQVERERQERLRRGGGIEGRGSSVGSADLSVDAAWEKVKRDRAKANAPA